MWNPAAVLPFFFFTLYTTGALGFSPVHVASRHLSASQLRHRQRQPPPHELHQSAATFSDAALWHKHRRKAMLAKYGDQIRPLEKTCTSQSMALPLLVATNAGLLGLSILSGSLPSYWAVTALAVFPGSILSLWQLQILHDALHGSLLNKQQTKYLLRMIPKRKLQKAILFFGSMPSVFGYYLYLQFGHLTHHNAVGSTDVRQLFESSERDFEDGDILFTAHRMRLRGKVGPVLPSGKEMSISRSAFGLWKEEQVVRNAVIFAASFLFERIMLVMNEAVVSLTGRNFFFPNKPNEFHVACTRYARFATLLKVALWKFVGFKSILFLYLSETLWSIPPHPCCAMFVTNHGSASHDDGQCWPTSSTYAGKWYSLLTLGTNYHLEHHDFERIPLTDLYRLHEIAPEFYPRDKQSNNIFSIMKRAFGKPDWYACTGVGT